MNAGRDTPRGPTATELRRRALDAAERTIPPGLGHLSREEWNRSVCSCRGREPKCTRCRALSYLNPRVEDWVPPADAKEGYATGTSLADILRWRERITELIRPEPVKPDALRCGYCGSMSPQGCPNGPCSFHG